ncbi:MAG: ABC transporter permease [Legionella sp.]|uniref:ABC transporter permease n=1 Tax=Legionella sp. TaxID=459 RepID=UPI0039E618CE
MKKAAVKLNSYFNGIWKARYFLIHLALADLRAKWRRSSMGILWSILQPLGMTLLLALVFSRLFHTDIVLYVPYILSGLLTWEFIASSLTGGSLAFVQADAYIKQIKHPLAIYTLRLIVSNLITFTLAACVLWVWAGYVAPYHINCSWLAVLSFFPLIAMITWPLATLLAYFGARFRDIPHAMGLILQASWFVSPVYFETAMFRNKVVLMH